ncbi:hypothetical protein FH972_024328 [Carpinus fangiana]|uniref:Uncharacterized protein n=1 Tax=Carpinus fangiana TaxID=176857 RepID=A0A5N6KY46_9ROSI|nr:hypothetical protein FH972_024328 [Carpinus fangiana]
MDTNGSDLSPWHSQPVAWQLPPPAIRITGPDALPPSMNDKRKTRNSHLSIDVGKASRGLSAQTDQSSAALRPRIRLPISPSTPVTAFQSLSLRSPLLEIADTPLNIFDSFLKHDELLHYLTTNIMQPSELLSLYSISKDFHLKVNRSHTAYILSAVRAWAPVSDPCPTASLSPNIPRNFLTSSYIDPKRPSDALTAPELLPFSLYKEHCHMDPILEHVPRDVLPEVAQVLLNGETGRAVPSFRYLFFITHEMAAARAVLQHLWQQHGLRVPADTLRTMGKLALLMHARNNAARLSLVHTRHWFTDADLFRANTLFMKLDMAFTDPLRRGKAKIKVGDYSNRGKKGLGRGLRQLMCAQHGWSVCARVLGNHNEYRTREDFTRLWTQGFFLPKRIMRQRIRPTFTAWGVPFYEMGRLKTEERRPIKGHKFRGRRKLMPLEEYIVREGVKRRLRMHGWILEMMTCGFIDPVTKENLPAPEGFSTSDVLDSTSPEDMASSMVGDQEMTEGT